MNIDMALAPIRLSVYHTIGNILEGTRGHFHNFPAFTEARLQPGHCDRKDHSNEVGRLHDLAQIKIIFLTLSHGPLCDQSHIQQTPARRYIAETKKGRIGIGSLLKNISFHPCGHLQGYLRQPLHHPRQVADFLIQNRNIFIPLTKVLKLCQECLK